MRIRLTLILFFLFCVYGCEEENENVQGQDAIYSGPVIDMHLHAMTAAEQGPPPLAICVGMVQYMSHDPRDPWAPNFLQLLKDPPCKDPLVSPQSDKELRESVAAELERLNVVGVLSGPRDLVEMWKAAMPERVIAGHQYRIGRELYTAQDVTDYYENGGFEVLSEVTNQYGGIEPDDDRFKEFWEMAAALDIPVGIHIGTGPPGAAHLSPGYRAQLHSPFLLESVLLRHPTLRVYIMHAAWPMRDEVMAMLYAHPHLYVDTGVLQVVLLREEYYDFLHALVRAGFGKRIMFGSDQMVWPDLIGEGIDAINEAPFLSIEQKTDILHDNAARFLRLDK